MEKLKNAVANEVMLKIMVWVFTSQLFQSELSGQQLPLFTQYRQYHSFLNPASVNNDYYLSNGTYNFNFGASWRSQWTGQGGTPKTALLSGEYIYNSGGTFGLVSGLNIIHDDTDPFSQTGVYGRIAAMMSGDPDYGGLSVGLTLGGVQYRFDAAQFRDYYLISGQDPDPLLGNDYSSWFPDVGAGIFYFQEIRHGNFKGDKFYLGISAPQLLGLNYRFQYEDNGEPKEFGIRREAHYYGVAGFYKTLADESYIELSSWVKYLASRSSIHADFNARGRIQNQFFMGIGFSTAKILHLEAGIYLRSEEYTNKNNIKLGYGYDYFYGSFGPFFGPSHELNLTFMLDSGD